MAVSVCAAEAAKMVSSDQAGEVHRRLGRSALAALALGFDVKGIHGGFGGDPGGVKLVADDEGVAGVGRAGAAAADDGGHLRLPDDRRGRPRREGQGVVFVFQKHHGLAGDPPRQGAPGVFVDVAIVHVVPPVMTMTGS